MLATDIHVIQLALEGVEERDHKLFTMIFAANKLELPPLPRLRPKAQGQRASSAQIKAWAAAQNARVRAGQRGRRKKPKTTPPQEAP